MSIKWLVFCSVLAFGSLFGDEVSDPEEEEMVFFEEESDYDEIDGEFD